MKYILFETKEPCLLETGTILRFLGEDFRFDFKDTAICMEILGIPEKGVEVPEIKFVPA